MLSCKIRFMEKFEKLYHTRWSKWRLFPNPEKGEYLYAPFGAGVYQLRNKETGQYVLFGTSVNLSFRMSSLLPKPYGVGKRNNQEKREYVWEHINEVEYRTIAFTSKKIAKSFESFVKGREDYLFKT